MTGKFVSICRIVAARMKPLHAMACFVYAISATCLFIGYKFYGFSAFPTLTVTAVFFVLATLLTIAAELGKPDEHQRMLTSQWHWRRRREYRGLDARCTLIEAYDRLIAAAAETVGESWLNQTVSESNKLKAESLKDVIVWQLENLKDSHHTVELLESLASCVEYWPNDKENDGSAFKGPLQRALERGTSCDPARAQAAYNTIYDFLSKASRSEERSASVKR